MGEFKKNSNYNSEMKTLSLLFIFSYGNFIGKKESSQFLGQKSKCGDNCAKEKGKCHRFCEEGVGSLSKKVCDCNCVLRNAKCLCKTCGYDDRCPEYREKSREGC